VVLSRRQPAPTAPAGSDEPPSTDEPTDELTGQSSGSTADEPTPAHDAGSTAESPVPAEADYVAPDE
jgi:hypothetical protein